MDHVTEQEVQLKHQRRFSALLKRFPGGNLQQAPLGQQMPPFGHPCFCSSKEMREIVMGANIRRQTCGRLTAGRTAEPRSRGRALSPGERRAPSTSGKPAKSTAEVSAQAFPAWWPQADTHHGDGEAEEQQQRQRQHVDAALLFEALVPGKKKGCAG